MSGVADPNTLANLFGQPIPAPPHRVPVALRPPIGPGYYGEENIARLARPLDIRESAIVRQQFGNALRPQEMYAAPAGLADTDGSSVVPEISPRLLFLNWGDAGPYPLDDQALIAHESTHTYQELKNQHRPQFPMLGGRPGPHEYFYGGTEALKKQAAAGKKFLDFGPEQQAAIIEEGMHVRPDRNNNGAGYNPDDPVYAQYRKQVQDNPAPVDLSPDGAFFDSLVSYIERKKKQHK